MSIIFIVALTFIVSCKGALSHQVRITSFSDDICPSTSAVFNRSLDMCLQAGRDHIIICLDCRTALSLERTTCMVFPGGQQSSKKAFFCVFVLYPHSVLIRRYSLVHTWTHVSDGILSLIWWLLPTSLPLTHCANSLPPHGRTCWALCLC